MRDVVETVSSASGRHKVEIFRRPDGLLEVIPLRWVEEVVPGYGKVAEFWERLGRTVSITDDIEVARSLAREFLTVNDPDVAAGGR